MISEFSAKATPTNKRAYYTFYLLLSLAAIAAVVYITVEKYKGVVGLVALGIIVGAVFIYTKYISQLYYYEITTDSYGTPVFVVRVTTGKRTSTMCRIDLSSITSLKREDKAARAAYKQPAGVVKYNYLPTLSPESTLLICSRSRYEKADIRIECNEEFANLLESYAAEAKMMKSGEDDE